MSSAESLEKTQHLVKKALHLKPTKLNRDNWLEWRKSFSMLGLLTFIHDTVASVFPRAFPPKKMASEERCSAGIP